MPIFLGCTDLKQWMILSVLNEELDMYLWLPIVLLYDCLNYTTLSTVEAEIIALAHCC